MLLYLLLLIKFLSVTLLKCLHNIEDYVQISKVFFVGNLENMFNITPPPHISKCFHINRKLWRLQKCNLKGFIKKKNILKNISLKIMNATQNNKNNTLHTFRNVLYQMVYAWQNFFIFNAVKIKNHHDELLITLLNEKKVSFKFSSSIGL